MQAENLAEVAQGDWLIPTTSAAGRDPEDDRRQERLGRRPWPAASELTKAPFQSVENYPQWKDQIATPAFQQYLADQIDRRPWAQKLTDGWGQVNG